MKDETLIVKGISGYHRATKEMRKFMKNLLMNKSGERIKALICAFWSPEIFTGISDLLKKLQRGKRPKNMFSLLCRERVLWKRGDEVHCVSFLPEKRLFREALLSWSWHIPPHGKTWGLSRI
jgi:hypothetical protein